MILKALLAKKDGTNSLVLDEDQKIVWASLSDTRLLEVLKMQAAKKSWAGLLQEDSGIGRCCPGSNFCGRLIILSVLPKLNMAKFPHKSLKYNSGCEMCV